MRCKKIKGFLIGYIKGSLDSRDSQIVDEHLSSCETCRIEMEHIKAIWIKLNDVEMEEPSPDLKENIDSMIESYSSGMNDIKGDSWLEKISRWLETWWPRSPMAQFATTLIVLVAGLTIGLNINGRSDSINEINQLKTDVNKIQQVVMSSLLNQSSVTERINGLTMSSQLKNVDAQLYSVLLLLLNTDSNVNVRLAAVNALSNFVEDEYVRHELIKSLSLQSSPLVQVSLIDLLGAIKEYNSYSTLIKIIDDPDTNEQVKKRAETALKQFI